jgi:hypothetical protein
MAWHWSVLIGICSSLVLALTGCAPSAPRSGTASADAFYAFPRAVPRVKATLQSVVNQLNGDIIIITGSPDEVAVDASATGTGTAREAARVLAGNRINLTNNANQIEISRADDKEAALLPRAWLHARVPPDIDLPAIRTRAGNIEVYGPVGKVTAIVTETGNIEVRGANGDVDLTTQKGSIIADIMGGKSIKANAKEGNLDLCAVDVSVTASTTAGGVRFIGTLRGGLTHTFFTTGAGSIQIAVPAYPKGHPKGQVYRVTASTADNSISVEFPAYSYEDGNISKKPLPICGVIHSSGPYDYHVENTSAVTGRIEVSAALTGTYFYTGTLADTYYRFDTSQTNVSFYTPVPLSIHIYTSAQLNQIIAGKESIASECQAALDTLSATAATVNLKTERGPILIQHIRMLGNEAQ